MSKVADQEVIVRIRIQLFKESRIVIVKDNWLQKLIFANIWLRKAWSW
jgi:hypothetical protein